MQKVTIALIAFFLLALNVRAQEDYADLFRDYLSKELKNYEASDFSELKTLSQHYSKSTELEHVYTQQSLNGIPIYNAIGNFAVKNNKVVSFANNLIPNIHQKANTYSPSITALDAVAKAAENFGLDASNLELVSSEDNKYKVSKANLSQQDIPVKLVYQPQDNKLKLAWDLNIHTLNSNHWWSVHVDAVNGTILNVADWTTSCNFEVPHTHDTSKLNANNSFGFKSLEEDAFFDDGSSYRVYPLGIGSPNYGTRSLVSNPSDDNASPYGWHDTDGEEGPEYTITRGNNVYAFENRDGDNNPGDSPDGGANLNFDFDLDLNNNPNTLIDPAITNLFYWNNLMHDIWYQYGFTEASGNFQNSNYGNGNIFSGFDYVNARGQDGADQGPGNNANFATPPDGQNPIMRMYTWSASGLPQALHVNTPTSIAGQYAGTFANFSPSLPEGGVTGDLVLVTDTSPDINDACNTITNSSEINGNIAIINRGDCSFVSKVQSAQNAGAIAVIIINNVPDELITMDGESTNIDIPSIFITLEDGNLIKDVLDNENINVTINNFGPFIKDGDFDGAIVAHEYGHGISNRLTGGASNAGCLTSCTDFEGQNCLNYTEQMGEGWSDYFPIVMNMSADDQPEDPKTIATYVLSQDANGSGLRPAPYSTDFNVNDFTYGDTNNASLSAPHGVGFVWGTMLWDLTWALVDEYGFDPDIYYGNGGNNMAMQLVIDGLKLQTCNPGFVDGRDAILLADQEANDGANQCLIWSVFANRGLGYSANQGDSLDRFDQTEAFDMPPQTMLDCSMGYSNKSIKEFSIYPNPANNIVNIESRNNLSINSVEIFDMNGRKVIEEKANTRNLNISKISRGIYLIKINSDQGSQTEKLIIE